MWIRASLKDWIVAEINLVDVSVRDGNQSLWGATGLASNQMLEIAGALDRVGFSAIDFTSSSHMAVAVRYFQTNPWDHIRRMRAAMPRTPLQFITTGLRFIAWQQADPDFMRIVYRRLQINGIRRFIMLDPMHDLDAVLEASRLIKEEGGAEVMAALTFTLSDVHDDAFYADFASKLAASPHVDTFYLKDPSGLMGPERARTLVPAVKAVIGTKKLEMHVHCTIGYGPLASLVGAELGASAVHVGIGPLGDGSALPEAVRMVANLRAMGHTVPVDDKALGQVSDYWWALARAEGLPAGTPQAFDASFLQHQIAGGVMTTMLRQLQELKLEHRLADVIAETEQVRRDLGQPIMVTPFPQMVCTQALFNVVGAKRYAQVSDQVVRYVLGKFGRPTRPVDEAVKAAILDRARAREIETEDDFPTLADLRKRFGATMDEEEFLLRAVMPGDQVDAMLAAGPKRRGYTPEAAPVLSLLKQLAAKPAARELIVERPGLRIKLTAGAGI
jgi:oxaloacetate decarboxylase alpha subunit